tara:strand:+ start:2198 stop:2446 length:249 start_codon:yes stop_codon:yes gene_type:complete
LKNFYKENEMGKVVNLREEEPPSFIVICTHKKHRHITSFGTFLDMDHAQHFIENYGFPEGEFHLKIAPLNIVWSKEESGYDS